jgi:hypothetical protein
MSTPEEMQSQLTGDERGTTQPVDEPMDVAGTLGQLRTLVCGLGAGLLIVSVALSAFVYKQNRNLAGVIAARQRQLSQLQQNGRVLDFTVNELVKYSAGKPELTALLAKHGIQMTPGTAGGQPAPQP